MKKEIFYQLSDGTAGSILCTASVVDETFRRNYQEYTSFRLKRDDFEIKAVKPYQEVKSLFPVVKIRNTPEEEKMLQEERQAILRKGLETIPKFREKMRQNRGV